MGACADTTSEIAGLTRGLASPRAHWPDAAARHLDGVLACRNGALSIVVLGGSMTEGQLAGGRCPPCVADTARRWSAVLERLLRGLLPSCRVAVHNRAARATTTEHVLHHAATIFSGDAAAPDLVLVDYALNDYKHGFASSGAAGEEETERLQGETEGMELEAGPRRRRERRGRRDC